MEQQAIVRAAPMALQSLVEAGFSVLQMMAMYVLLDLQCPTDQEEWGCETGQLHENRPFSAFWPQSTRLGGSLSGKDVLATSRKLSMPWGCILQTLRPFPAFPDQPEPLKRYAGGLGGTKAASLQRFLFIR